jgi:nitrite reductase/ring-hydroxylating ferredoxin subunit
VAAKLGRRPIGKGPTRRDLVSSAVGLTGLALTSSPLLAAKPKKPEQLPPQIGDRFEIIKGSLKGELLKPDLLKVGDAPAIGFPFATVEGVLRKKNRLNRLLLVQLDPDDMYEPTRAAAAGGVLVFSAVCTHRGCTIESWKAEEQHFRCHCHLSEFAPLSEGSVLNGPAKRPLAMVPVDLDDEGFVVAKAEFNRKPGPQKK